MSESSYIFDAEVIRNAADRIVSAIKSASAEQTIILKSLLKVILDIEITKISFEILVSEHIQKELQGRFEAALKRYTSLYISIIQEFTNDVVENLEHFIKLVKENLDPLRKIARSMRNLLREIESVNPIEEDRDLLNAAISMYNKRESVARMYLEHERNIFERIESVKKSKRDFVDSLKNVLLPEVKIKDLKAFLFIPVYVVRVRTRSGETKTVIFPLSKKAKYRDLFDKLFYPKKISDALKEKIERSIQNKTHIVKFKKPRDKAKERAKKILLEIVKHKEEEKIIKESLK